MVDCGWWPATGDALTTLAKKGIISVTAERGPNEGMRPFNHRYLCDCSSRLLLSKDTLPGATSPAPRANDFFNSLRLISLPSLTLAAVEQPPQHRFEQRILLGDDLGHDLAFALAVAGQSRDGREGLRNGAVTEGAGQVGEVGVVGL
jgi:hypothetical protein